MNSRSKEDGRTEGKKPQDNIAESSNYTTVGRGLLDENASAESTAIVYDTKREGDHTSWLSAIFVDMHTEAEPVGHGRDERGECNAGCCSYCYRGTGLGDDKPTELVIAQDPAGQGGSNTEWLSLLFVTGHVEDCE